MHIVDLFRRQAERFPDSPAYYFNGETYTWSELYRRSSALAAALQAAGVNKGDGVAIIGGEGINSIETWYACLLSGALRIGLNPRFTAVELRAVLDKAQPRVLLASADQFDKVQQAADVLGLEPLLIGDDSGTLDMSVVKRLDDGADSAQLVAVPHNDDDEVAVIFTSGSTGLPKGIVYANDQVLQAVEQVHLGFGLTKNDVFIRSLPTFGLGILYASMNVYLGYPCVLMERFDVEEKLKLIERYGATAFFGSGTILQWIASFDRLDEYDLSSLRIAGYGQAPASPALIRKFNDRLSCGLYQVYGMTETHGFSAMLDWADHQEALETAPHRLESCGRPMPHVDIEVVGPDGEPLAAGEVGEIHIAGDVVSRGYRGPESEDGLKEGVVFTGDMGRFDSDGYLYMVDRKKFMIITGGFNVYPVEVENVLAEHPAIDEVCVIGLEDQRWGQRIHAVLVAPDRDDYETLEAELMEMAALKLAGFKMPKTIEFRDELPHGATGKLLKGQIQNEYANQD